MNNTRNHKILCWNIRGINSQAKWDAIRDKINESNCNIVCLQETKKETFDRSYIRKFCTRNLDTFSYSPSTGASWGILTVWNSQLYHCDTIQINSYALTLKVTSLLDQNSFHLTNVYGPAHSDSKLAFVTSLINLDTTDFEDWILIGDFNLYRNTENRNKPGGNSAEM